MADFEKVGSGRFGAAGTHVAGLLFVEKRMKLKEQEFFDLIDRFESVEEVFHAIRDAMTEATMSVRVPEPGNVSRGWTYAVKPDHAIRVAAARTMAQILGLIKTGQGVIVNNDNRTLSVGQGNSLAELAAVGVPRETVEAACRDLLASVSVSEKQGAEVTK